MEDQFDKLARLRDRTFSQADCDKILDAMLTVGSYEQLESLRDRTFSQTDCDKILDAMLTIGSYEQLESLRDRTFSQTDSKKILDAMLSKISKKAKNTQVTRLPLTKHSYKKQYDVFIAHASEDKGFASPLAKSLRRKDLEVWYDDFVLKLGDSLQREIDRGLARSRYGVLILSHNFFNKLWPQKEHDGLASKEQLGRKTILPIWHNINKEEVAFYSPTLAGRYAAKSSLGIEYVVNKIIEVISSRK